MTFEKESWESWKTYQLQILQEIGNPKEQQEAVLRFLLWLHDNNREQVNEVLVKIKNQIKEGVGCNKEG